MDPNTVIVTLAVNLVFSGGLYYLIGRNMPPASGLGLWAAAAMLLGAAYLTRLLEGLDSPTLLSPLLDVAMVAAAMLFLGGLRQFVGQPAGRPATLWIGLAAYVAALGLGLALWDLQGRYALLNIALGLMWSTLGLTAARAMRRNTEPALRMPLALTAGMVGALGLLTLLRGATIVQQGIESMYGTRQSEIYYGYASLAVVLLALTLLWMVFMRLHAQLAELASRDALTRLLNRNGLDDALKRHFATRDAQPVILLQVDVDHFKQINDSHGHASGDALLRAVAATLTRHARASDFVARVGGEEFVVGCIGGDAAIVTALAERLCRAVGALELATPGKSALRCTVSVGLSRQFTRLADWEVAWREADDALYAAKSAGRNRVEAFETSIAPG
jgi:diguanylate cyclase (GGDEF)-like protein